MLNNLFEQGNEIMTVLNKKNFLCALSPEEKKLIRHQGLESRHQRFSLGYLKGKVFTQEHSTTKTIHTSKSTASVMFQSVGEFS